MSRKIVTLLTDFGTKDGYAGSIKGVLKRMYPDTEIIDISHEIDPFDIKSAAYCLHGYHSHFPKDTIHICVVDPGVGGSRRPLLIRTAQHYFIGPDNGIFRFIFTREAYTAYEIIPDKLTGLEISPTFHARDIFAPAAGKILNGVNAEKFAKRLDERTEIPNLFFTKEGDSLKLETITIDRFGNIVTGFSKRDLERLKKNIIEQVTVKDFTTNEINVYYEEKKDNELMALWNSMDFLEIAQVNGNAAKSLKFNKNIDIISIKIK